MKKTKVANSPHFLFFFLNFAWSISSKVDSPAVALVAKRVQVGRKRCPKTSTWPPSPATRPLVSKGFVDLEVVRPIKVESEDAILVVCTAEFLRIWWCVNIFWFPNIDGLTLRNENERTICHKDIEYYKYTSCKIWDTTINTISILHWIFSSSQLHGLAFLSPFPVKVMTNPLTRQVSEPARRTPGCENQPTQLPRCWQIVQILYPKNMVEILVKFWWCLFPRYGAKCLNIVKNGECYQLVQIVIYNVNIVT